MCKIVSIFFHLSAVCLLLVLATCITSSATCAQTAEEGGTSSGRLKSFEKAMRDSAETDTATVYRLRHNDHDDDDDSGGFWAELIFFIPKEIFKACVAAYCSLPCPNYGPYPYFSLTSFTVQYEREPASYLLMGGSYSHVYKNIPSGQVEASLYIHSFHLGASYQQLRENGDRMQLASARIGVRKALGDYVLWQNHLGWRYLKGSSEMSGLLIGMQFRIFTLDRFAYNIGYDFDVFPEYGTAFHELDGGISYFKERMEIKAGYQAKMIYKGPSLHGPYAGVAWNL